MQNLTAPVRALQKMWNLSKKNVSFYLGGISHQIKNGAVTNIFLPCNFIFNSVPVKK